MTPASSKKSKIIQKVDLASGVTGLASALPIAAGMFVPVAAPVILAATSVGLLTAGYTTVRSGMQLDDRKKHSQSLSLKDRDARNNWLGVAGGVVGIGASGATQALKFAANAGKEISVVSISI